jgi:hypothetical protein
MDHSKSVRRQRHRTEHDQTTRRTRALRPLRHG